MKLSEEKITIIQKVIGLEDEDKLEQIYNLLADENETESISEVEMQSIERGLKDLDAGHKISLQEFKEKLNEWIIS